MRIILIILMMVFASSVFAFDVETIIVDKCRIEVAIAETQEEHARGLLGYTERTFPYGGMLFRMDRRGKKIFHTRGMQMPIRIMGVSQTSNGAYRVVTDIYFAPPGLESIPVNAPDVLEIPEMRYQMVYKNCLMAREGQIRP